MNADDRELISGLFDRMKGVGALEKDRVADTLINDSMRRNPDSPYLLVQSVLVQERALQEADGRIQALEKQVADLEAQGGSQAAASGSFAAPRSSPGFGAGRTAPTPAVPVTKNSVRQRGDSGGGFMAQAMTTAAGVAGGMLLASGIQSLFSGSSQSSTPEAGASDATLAADSGNTAAGDAGADQQLTEAAQSSSDQQSDNDAIHDAAAEDGGWEDWGGDDD